MGLGSLALMAGAAQGAAQTEQGNINYQRSLNPEVVALMQTRPGLTYQQAEAIVTGNTKALGRMQIPTADPGMSAPPSNPVTPQPSPIPVPTPSTPDAGAGGIQQVGAPVNTLGTQPAIAPAPNPAMGTSPQQPVNPDFIKNLIAHVTGAGSMDPRNNQMLTGTPMFTPGKVSPIPIPSIKGNTAPPPSPTIPTPAAPAAQSSSVIPSPAPIQAPAPAAPSQIPVHTPLKPVGNLLNTPFGQYAGPSTEQQIWDSRLGVQKTKNDITAAYDAGKLKNMQDHNGAAATKDFLAFASQYPNDPQSQLFAAQQYDKINGSNFATDLQQNGPLGPTSKETDLDKRTTAYAAHQDALDAGIISKNEADLFSKLGTMNPVQQKIRIDAFNAANPGANIPFDPDHPYTANADVQALINQRNTEAALNGQKSKYWEPYIKSVMGANASKADMDEAQALAIPQNVQINAQKAAIQAYDADTRRQLGVANYNRLAADSGYQSTIKQEGLLQSQIDGLTSQNQRASDSMNMSPQAKQGFIEANNKQIADLQDRLNSVDQTRAQYLQQASTLTPPSNAPTPTVTAPVQQPAKGSGAPIVTHDPSTAQYTLAHGGSIHTKQGVITQPGGPGTPYLLNGKPWAPAK